MIASAHIAAGLVSGMAAAYLTERRSARVAIAFGAGLLSHVLLDALPHSDYAPLRGGTILVVAACEILAMAAIGVWLLRPRLLAHWQEYLIPGFAGATLPDLKFFGRLFLSPSAAASIEHYGNYFHSYFHADPSRPAVGWTIEIVCTIALIGMLIAFPRRDEHGGATYRSAEAAP